MRKIEDSFETAFQYHLNRGSNKHWLPNLGETITFDPRFKLISFPIPPLVQETMGKLFQSLNEFIQNEIGIEDAFKALETVDEKLFMTLNFSTLEKLAGPEMDENRHVLQGHMRQYSNHYAHGEYRAILRKALNIDTEMNSERKVEWQSEGLKLDWLVSTTDDGTEHKDIFLLLNRHGRPPAGCVELAEKMEIYIARIAEFLEGSAFPSAEQNKLLDEGLLEDITHNLLIRVGKKPKYFIPAISLLTAKRMAECGITIDLRPFIDRHFSNYDNNLARYEEDRDCRIAFSKAYNLDAFIDDHDLKFQGHELGSIRNSISCYGYEDREEGFIDLEFDYLTRQETAHLKDQFNAVCGAPVFTHDTEWSDTTLSTNYIHADAVLRSGKPCDLSPAFEKAANLQIARIAYAQKALDDLGDTIGCRGWKDTSGYPQSLFSKKDSSKWCQLSLHLGNEFWAQRGDFENSVSIYAELAEEFKTIIEEAGLADKIISGDSSGVMTGGVTGHGFSLYTTIHSIDEVEALTAKLAPFSDRLRPVMEKMLVLSSTLNHERIPGKPSGIEEAQPQLTAE